MDSNQPVNPAPSTATPTQPVQPAQPVAPAQPNTNAVQPPTSGNNKLLWVILGLLILIVLAGGAYWYMNGQSKVPTESVKSTPKPSAPIQNVDALEKDINSASLDDLDKEFTSVDQDLQSL